MSVLIGNLAFVDPKLIYPTKIGVLEGSLASALHGMAILRACKSCRPAASDVKEEV